MTQRKLASRSAMKTWLHRQRITRTRLKYTLVIMPFSRMEKDQEESMSYSRLTQKLSGRLSRDLQDCSGNTQVSHHPREVS